MTDGNIVAAKAKLSSAVNRLCDPRMAVYHDQTRYAPSLYMQLATDLSGTQGDTRTPAKSLPPLWLDAVLLLNDMDKQVRTWKPCRRATTPQRLAMLRDKPWRPQDTETVTDMHHTINAWCESILSLQNPESVKHISAPCPSCGRAIVYRRDKAGDLVRQPALKIVTNVGCSCQHCQAHWGPERYMFLCKLLGFDLPEGVLE
jgi:predicted RNA-binding Zn-ribbon protein involved in translation (DUF1610 family)